MSDKELKPCPFCGAEVLGPCGADYYGPFYIIKHKKDCFFPTISGQHVTRIRERSGKINVWNTRAPDPMLEELAGALHVLFAKATRYGYDFQLENEIEEGKVAMQKYQQSKVQP